MPCLPVCDRIAASIDPDEELGLADPGLTKPVIGLPPLVTGLNAKDGPDPVDGLCIDVPGLGRDETEFSSNNMSAIPSSSISKSSIQHFSVNARHFRNQAAWS